MTSPTSTDTCGERYSRLDVSYDERQAVVVAAASSGDNHCDETWFLPSPLDVRPADDGKTAADRQQDGWEED